MDPGLNQAYIMKYKRKPLVVSSALHVTMVIIMMRTLRIYRMVPIISIEALAALCLLHLP